MTGRKIYENVLKVDHLNVVEFNNITMDDTKTFVPDPALVQGLVVTGNLECPNLQVTTINNVNLEKLAASAVYIKQLQNISTLNFETVEVRNLTVKNLNGKPMDQILAQIDKLKNITQIDVVRAEKSVEITRILNLSKINDFYVDDLRSGVDMSQGPVILDTTKFERPVTIRNLVISVINDIDFRALLRRALYKSWNQTITKHFKFDTIKSRNLITEFVNDVNITQVIDVTDVNPQTIHSKLKFEKSVQAENLHATCSCDLKVGLQHLRNPFGQFWDNVIILGNATFWDRDSSVVRILEHAVTNTRDQVFTGRVTFNNHISIENMLNLGRINNVNVSEIMDDAFLNNQNINQAISGTKRFSQLRTNKILCLKALNVTVINDINMNHIKDKVIFKQNVEDVLITGKKTFFAGLQTKNFQTDSIPMQNLITTDDCRVPSAILENIKVVDNIWIKSVNRIPFDEFLRTRMLKSSPGQKVTGKYIFSNMEILGNASMMQLNAINIDDIVFDTESQVIESRKVFKRNVTVIGNMSVELINGYQLSKLYHRAFTNAGQNVHNASVTILGPVDVTNCTTIQTNFINGVPAEYILEMSNRQAIKLEANEIHTITKKISEFLKNYLNVTKSLPNQVLYLERSANLQLAFANTTNAQIIETPNAVLLHIESEESGARCGLPNSCPCPVQQTMQISSGHSINMFLNKEVQRVYSYYTDELVIHVVTNSISTGSYCRTNKTKVMNEVSSITWNTIPGQNTNGGLFLHQTLYSGYINNVLFFSTSTKTYVVIGFYYDPVLDSHNVLCLVLGFDRNENKFNEVQKLPNEGLKIISLFHTSEGVILIMGGLSQSANTSKTVIFRFNDSIEKFEVLRTIPTFNSIHAVGVVLRTDNLIVLANELSMLLILRYQESSDNYQFYQSIQMGNPVLSLSVFYSGDFGISDAYLSVVTDNDRYTIFSFQFIEGWKLECFGSLDGIRSLIPFRLNNKGYLFAPSSRTSSLLILMEHDSN